MLIDNYPIGMDECTSNNMSGSCNSDCYVYLDGKCPEPEEMVSMLKTLEQIMIHSELYLEKE